MDIKHNEFYQAIIKVAAPITIQSILQAALSLIDIIMIGDLGDASVAGVGLTAKYTSLFTVTVTAIVTVAGILIAQNKGNNNSDGINSSFFFNLYFSLALTLIFTVLSALFPKQIMGLYSPDSNTVAEAALYLRIVTIGFIPQVITLMISTVLRNIEFAKYATIASSISVITNTLLNYLLIYGIWIFPKMGIVGAALATSISRVIELAIILILYKKARKQKNFKLTPVFVFHKEFVRKGMIVLAPILLSEFMWSVGENVYTMIYGHIGTAAFAGMTLTNAIQTIAIGALSGIAASAGIIVGESLGSGDYDKAYSQSKSFLKITIIMAVIISVIIALLAPYYVKLFNVSQESRNMGIYILYAYSVIFTAKVINMVLTGGIIRSGGETKYIMFIDLIGTWIFGVPLGLITAYVFKMPIYWVYFILSLEEVVRVIMGVIFFRSKRWMKNIAGVKN